MTAGPDPAPRIDALREGLQVTPNIRLVRLLGRGGMGSVWVADHLTLETQVAVKFISAEIAGKDPRMVERFGREARITAKIKSPHIVQTFDHGVMEDGTPYIVMELLAGQSLTDRIASRGALTLRETELLVAQAAEVLGKAHELGIVHRDIKPDNLFCIDSGYDLFLKVLDFGIAKQSTLPAEHGMTRTGAMLGTPYYMSPEQVTSAKHADFRADLWALAVSVYQALTARVPFNGETLGSLCIAIAAARFEPPSGVVAGLPSPLDGWFAKALHHDASQRYQSARELAEAFSQAVSGERRAVAAGATIAQAPALAAAPGGPTLTGAATTLEPVTRKSKTPLVLVAVFVVALVAGIVMVVGLEPGSSATADTSSAPAAVAPSTTAGPTTEVAAEPPAPADSETPTGSDHGDTTPSAESAAVSPPVGARPPGTPPKPTVSITQPSAKAQPANCEGDNALVFENGKYRVRPECQ